MEVVSANHDVKQVIVLEKAQPLYMKAQSFVEIGKLEAKQSFVIIGEDEMYYELRFGEMSAFVKKTGVTIENRAVQSLVNPKIVDSIKTIKETIVYEQANFHSAELLHLAKGFRYPIIGQIDDWFIIKIGERTGYIQKQSVEKDHPDERGQGWNDHHP